MSEDVFAHAGLAETHADLMRNIVSLRVSQDLFDDLSDRPADWDAAIALEVATKPPAFSSAQPVLHRPFEEARWNDAIHYPFRHWMRSRYSDGSFGVWYGADSIETTRPALNRRLAQRAMQPESLSCAPPVCQVARPPGVTCRHPDLPYTLYVMH